VTFEKEVEGKELAFIEFLSDFFFNEIILNYFSNYKRLGRKYIFSPERTINLKEHDIEIWQGFRYEVRDEITTASYGSANGPSSGLVPMLNVDVDFLIVRLETALDIIKETAKCLETSSNSNFDDRISVS
jgi:hypothetical protein